ncbi:MAG: hypothetical protein IJV40_05705 [Oscillospiraceae bacterium]|nr:hypothetical protein [Oscillospiraceae bacterium]
MRKQASFLFSLCLALGLSACAEAVSPVNPAEACAEAVSPGQIAQTGYTTSVPAAYLQASAQPGTVTRLDYESRDYVRDSAPITKTAWVYTPCGYDESDLQTRYNILYLMHGWGGHAGNTLNLRRQKTSLTT